jgi:hypothetical protein
MTSTPSLGSFSTEDIDTTRPHPARMYDFYLGGKDNYEVDRVAAAEVSRLAPNAVPSAKGNRAWMRRAARRLAEVHGVRQFLDIGTGIPTQPNLHEIVQGVAPETRIVYADNDPIVLTHARALLTSSPEGRTSCLRGDLRDPESILDAVRAEGILDWEQPVALVLSAILHFITEAEGPAELIAHLRDALPPGSYLALSHGSIGFDPKVSTAAADVYEEKSATAAVTLRSRERIEELFAGFTLLDPGVVQLPLWHPDGAVDPRWLESVWLYGGVGRKES